MKPLRSAFVLAAVAVLGLALMTACGGSSPTAPSVISVAGTWGGTMFDSSAGWGIVHVTVSQSGSALTGTWTFTFANPANNIGGTLAGNVNGRSVTATLAPSAAASCSFTLAATVAGDQMTGTYESAKCAVVVTKLIALSRLSGSVKDSLPPCEPGVSSPCWEI